MKMTRIASVPLVTHDPYFSVWSGADRLYEDDTRHWSGREQRLNGALQIGGKEYRFLGRRADWEQIHQVALDVTALSTKYVFENEKAVLELTFTSPLLPDNLRVLSRPCTYIRFKLRKKEEASVSLRFEVASDFIKSTAGAVFGNVHGWKEGETSFDYAFMYKGNQHILGHSGDNLTIDWGNVCLAARKGEAKLSFDQKTEMLRAEINLDELSECTLALAFDDILSVNYMGDARPGYWKKFYRNLPEAVGAAFEEEREILEKCRAFDRMLEEKAMEAGGEEYALLCNLSYRQAVAGHKLVTDREGNLLFLSKECDSNGCIGTVDVSYPSSPLFLYFQPELVKGMLRPVFAFAALPVWEFDFAPHDVGRYPYAVGQVYGLDPEKRRAEFSDENGMIFPFFCDYPPGTGVYSFRMQMPVEECGNMLIMTAAVCRMERSGEFAKPYLATLKKWTEYLACYGKDPKEQLCTDDFAGHLGRNVNLSAKAAMGIEAFAQIQGLLGEQEAMEHYHGIAKDFARYLVENAVRDDYTLLTYGKDGNWSLKYNTVWDKFFGSGLFPESFWEREVDFYLRETGSFGVPLDSRKVYTKSDWILWCCAMTSDRAKRKGLLEPVARFVKETKDRVPFSDWYDTQTGEYCHFKGRTVQGGIFMPMLMDNISLQ